MLKSMPHLIYEAAASNGLDEETVDELCQAYLVEYKAYPENFGQLLKVIE